MNYSFLLASAAVTETPVTENALARMAGQFGVNTPLLIAQIINFCLVAFLLYRFAFKPILNTLDTRQAKIAQSLQYAEEIKNKLSQIEAQYSESVLRASLEAQKIIQQAKDNAQTLLDQKLSEAQLQAKSLLKEGQETLLLEQSQMIAKTRHDIVQLVVDTTQKVLAQKLSPQVRSEFNQTASEMLSQKSS